MRGWRAVVIAILLLSGSAVVVQAQGKPASRVASNLGAIYNEHVARAAGLAVPSSHGLARVAGGRVVIDAVADGDVATLEAELKALGMQDVSVYGRVVSGALPLDSIPALDHVSSLRSARPSYAVRRVGLTTTQGDQAMRADAARSIFGVSGAGVQVGVLSDSFDCLHGAAADVSSGDLSTVTVVQELPNCTGATDEGRAMLQIIHDVAPGASLSFATASGGSAAFAHNILALQKAGAKVIVDDIGYLDEPMFQDGIIAQAVDAVAALGSAYFSAGGNDGRNSYESGFNVGATFAQDAIPSAPGAPRFFGGVAHNFTSSGPTPQLQRITIPSGGALQMVLQWDSPFHSAGGLSSTNDVDVYLLNPAGTQVVAAANDDNVTSGDAFEVLTFVNSGPTADFNLMIVTFKGSNPGRIKYIHFGDATIKDFATSSSTLIGHPNAAGAGGVGAAFFGDTPAFGVNPPIVESFSSAGGTPILFDTGGNRLGAAIIRQKPDFIAPDGVNTTFFGQSFPDGDNFPNFFGTSAAAPHAAAVAALLLQKEPSLAPATIITRLRQSTIDMGSPGFDFDTGFGLIQADIALGGRSPLVAAVLPSSRSVQVNGLATVFATVINSGQSTAPGVTISQSAVPGTFAFQTTNPATNVPTGTPNTPVDIPPGGIQTFVLSFVPNAVFGPADVTFNIAGNGVPPVTPIIGVNTLLLSASATPVPDIVALAATPAPGLITNIPGPNGVGAFAVATVNVGASGSITVTADTGGAVLPVTLSLCQTDPVSAQCLGGGPSPSVTTTINAGATPTFSIFATGHGNVPFAPATNRIFVRFKDSGGATRGSTSTAVQTQ